MDIIAGIFLVFSVAASIFSVNIFLQNYTETIQNGYAKKGKSRKTKAVTEKQIPKS